MLLSMKLFNGSLLLSGINFLALQIWMKSKFQFYLLQTPLLQPGTSLAPIQPLSSGIPYLLHYHRLLKATPICQTRLNCQQFHTTFPQISQFKWTIFRHFNLYQWLYRKLFEVSPWLRAFLVYSMCSTNAFWITLNLCSIKFETKRK